MSYEQRTSLLAGDVFFMLGYEKHGIVDYTQSSRLNPIFGTYRVGQAGAGYDLDIGPLDMKAWYNALDGEHPIYVDVGLELLGVDMGTSIRCPLPGDGSHNGDSVDDGFVDTLAGSCYTETRFRVQRDFADSKFGAAFTATHFHNLDTLENDYSWSTEGEVPSLPGSNITASVGLTYRP